MLGLLEIVFGIFELVFFVFELIEEWHFYATVVLSVALAGILYLLIPDKSLGGVISISIAVLGLVAGMIWQWRNK